MMPELTSEAVRVAVFLLAVRASGIGELRCDAQWRSATARLLLLSPAVIEKALRELADAELIALSGRVHVQLNGAPVSEGGGSLAICRAPHSPSAAETSTSTESASATESASRVLERNDDGADKLAASFATARSTRSRRSVRAKRPASASGAMSLDLESAASAACGVEGETDERRAVLNGEVRAAIDVFDRLYREANDGAKPTWGARQFSTMRTLVEKHGRTETERRISNMFLAPPRFPAPPYDLSTLVQHFDKFARPGSMRGGMIDRWQSGEDYYNGGQ